MNAIFHLAFVLITASLLLTQDTTAGTPYFDAPFRSFEAPEPSQIEVADFNHDQLPDVISNCTNGVGLMLGRRDGTLGPLLLWPAGRIGLGLAVGDLNGDGNLDCLRTDGEKYDLSIFFGNGDGTFKPRKIIPVFDPTCVGIGDFNHDGRPDIAVANYGPHTMSILTQTPQGEFSAPVTSPSGGFASTMFVRDMDSDGNVDIVYSGGLGYGILYGDGNGSFGLFVYYAVNDWPLRGFAVEDLDRDTHPDLVFALNSGLFVRRGRYDRTFTDPVHYEAGDMPNSVAIGDVTGDRVLDLIVCLNNSEKVSILPGTRHATFGSYSLHPTGQSSIMARVGDFNHDGFPDLAIADFHDSICILTNNGDNTIGKEESYSTEDYPTAMTLGDLNNDLRPDLIYVTDDVPPGSRLWVRITDASGFPGAAIPYDIESRPHAVVAADFNNDGWTDLAAGSNYWLNDGTGGLGSRKQVSADPRYLVSGDFIEDGLVDLVGVQAVRTSPVRLIPGNGDGTFDVPIAMSGPNEDWMRAFTAADVDEDGHLDLVYTGTWGSGNVLVSFGDGAGHFSSDTWLIAGMESWHSEIADIDHDGCPDIATAIYSDGAVALFRGHCDRTFDPPILIDVGTYPSGVTCANFDGDSFLDLAVSNSGANTVTFLRGNGSFGFARTDLGTGGQPWIIQASDFDHAGGMDLVTMNGFASISILRNNGSIAGGIGDSPSSRPVLSNSPNPFPRSTTFSFTLPEPGRVTLTIHDVQGRIVKEIVREMPVRGEQHLSWDGLDRRGVPVPQGLYLARLDTPGVHLTRKMFKINR